MQYRLRTLLITVTIASVALGAITAFCKRKHESSCGMSPSFAEMPENDEELLRWLRIQPGIIAAEIERTPDGLSIEWSFMAPEFGNPPEAGLDFTPAFVRFGYWGPSNERAGERWNFQDGRWQMRTTTPVEN